MFAQFIWTVTFMFADFIWTVTLTFVVTVWTFLWMNFDEYKQHIFDKQTKVLFCVQVQKEPVSVIVECTHSILLQYNTWRHFTLTVTRFPQWTLTMKMLHIDSYTVPAVDSNHILHVGGDGVSSPRRTGSFNLVNWLANYPIICIHI